MIGVIYECGGALEQVVQRTCGCSWISGSVQGEVGCGSEQPVIAGGVPAQGKGWNKMVFRVTSNPNHPVITSLVVEKAEKQEVIYLTVVLLYFLAASLYFFRKDKDLFYGKNTTLLSLQYLPENVVIEFLLLGRSLAL